MDAVVYDPIYLAALIERLVFGSGPITLLIICADRQNFTTHLSQSIARLHGEREQVREPDVSLRDDQRPEDDSISLAASPLLRRTIELLSMSRKIRLAFCPSVSVLQAYLSILPDKLKQDAGSPRLAECASLGIFNPLSLHKQTASYSAQGISKTFAAAVEAALILKCRLFIIETKDEYLGPRTGPPLSGDEEHQTTNEGETNTATETTAMAELSEDQQDIAETDNVYENPWEQQVPILNVTTKTFGISAERSISQKTVKLADVAARWFRFETLHAPAAHDLTANLMGEL